MVKIALGAGHYIGTSGKRVPASLDPKETREWQLNDRVCDRVELGLTRYEGYELLRLDDSDDGADDITLSERANRANNWGADVYLSVHHNAAGRIFSGGGIVLYVHPQASEASFAWRDELYDALIRETGLAGNRANPKTTANFQILRETNMPAVLLELGFMDSTVDAPVILTDEYAQQCADAIVEVLVAKFNLKEKPVKTEKRFTRFQDVGGIRVAEVPVEQFRVVYYDGKKKSMRENRCTGGFFGSFKEGKERFTFPAGHTVCDYEATQDLTRRYCEAWGSLRDGKFFLNSGAHEYMNPFYRKSVTTLTVAGGRAQVNDLTDLDFSCDYAISGVPVMRGGEDVKFKTYVKGQGWTGAELRATWHVFLGLKEACADTIYVLAMKTKTSNLIYSAEAYKKLKGLGFHDVIKLDGGGSFHWNAGGKKVTTVENRHICTVIDMGQAGANPYAAPSKTLRQGSTGEGVKWLQWELNSRGFSCEVDGSFGPATVRQLRAYQADRGLTVDGSCGPATRASLLA